MMPQKTMKKSLSIADKVSSLNVVEGSINSPLHRFVRAKKKINQTFDEIMDYLKESRQFLIDCEISNQYDGETKRDLKKVNFQNLVIIIIIFDFVLIKHQSFKHSLCITFIVRLEPLVLFIKTKVCLLVLKLQCYGY